MTQPTNGRAPRAPYNVKINIEQLVLHGFPPADRHRIARALQRELARVCAEQGVLPLLTKEGTVDRIDAGEFRMPAHSHAGSVGEQLALSVYRGMNE